MKPRANRLAVATCFVENRRDAAYPIQCACHWRRDLFGTGVTLLCSPKPTVEDGRAGKIEPIGSTFALRDDCACLALRAPHARYMLCKQSKPIRDERDSLADVQPRGPILVRS